MKTENKLQKDFNDIIAEKTDWTLLNTASSTFDPRKMVCVNSHRIEYRMTWFSKLLINSFIVTGLWGLSIDKVFIFFIFMGIIALYCSSFPITFDKKLNIFSRGWRSELFKPFMTYVEINFSEIYALQLVGGEISGSDGGSYSNYQINLINKDSQRLNISYYSNKTKAKRDAEILKLFLDTRLWDAI